MKLLEWFLKTEPSFDIGIFITLIASIIGFCIKDKKDKEESKKQKERYEEESEERFKAIEKQIILQKEVEKEIFVRKYNIDILDEIEKERSLFAEIFSNASSSGLSSDSFGELINKVNIMEKLITNIIFYNESDKVYYTELFEIVVEKEKYKCGRIRDLSVYCHQSYCNLSEENHKEFSCNVMKIEAYYIMLGTDLRYAKKYEHLNFKKNKSEDDIKKLIEDHNRIIKNEEDELKLI